MNPYVFGFLMGLVAGCPIFLAMGYAIAYDSRS